MVNSKVRRLARRGELTDYVRTVAAGELRRLRADAAGIVWPLVYQRVTRPAEHNRGHLRCASAVQRLAPECLDRFHDDVEAVVDDLFAHADRPIENLEGWLTMRMPNALVEGYRKRRGRRGAPQRPRVPIWLADALAGNAWLIHLAKLIMDWAGTDATAGTARWPLTRWAELRLRHTGDVPGGEATVAAEVEAVLSAMRKRPDWYERNVEGPLDRKPAPIWYQRPGTSASAEPEPLEPMSPLERDDALLGELASRSIDVMTQRIDGGERLEDVVAEVLDAVFGAVPISYDLDRPPGAPSGGPDQVVTLIKDPERMQHIIEEVAGILRRPKSPLRCPTPGRGGRSRPPVDERCAVERGPREDRTPCPSDVDVRCPAGRRGNGFRPTGRLDLRDPR